MVFIPPTPSSPAAPHTTLPPLLSLVRSLSLQLQVWIFRQRYLNFIDAAKHVMETGQGVILDRSVYSDKVFAGMNHTAAQFDILCWPRPRHSTVHRTAAISRARSRRVLPALPRLLIRTLSLLVLSLLYSILPPSPFFLMKTDVNLEEENITEEGYAFYRFLRDGALKPVPIPHICVYLDAAAQLCLDRVNSRNRGCESGIPVAYLEKLGKVRVHRLTVVPVPRRPNGCIGAGRCFHNKAFALIFIPRHLLMFCFCFL